MFITEYKNRIPHNAGVFDPTVSHILYMNEYGLQSNNIIILKYMHDGNPNTLLRKCTNLQNILYDNQYDFWVVR